MTLKRTLLSLCTVALSAAYGGCSVSMSAGNKATIVGKDKIVVSADQPAEAAPAPTEVSAPKIKPPKHPMKAKVVGSKIEITEKVMFEYDKATIKGDSHALLNDVATVIKQHPSIAKIRIEGHTDSDGSDKYNKKLSQDRADAVMQFLVGAGIEANRLEAVGYGEEKPIADNKTDEGKERNRRVEFNIIKINRGR